MLSERGSSLAILIFGFLFLFFFQLLSDFVGGVYTLGVLGTGLPVEMAYLLLFFSPILLLVFQNNISRLALVIMGEIFILCRLIVPLLPLEIGLIVSGIGVATFLLFLPGLLWTYGQGFFRRGAIGLTVALAVGLALSIFLRSLVSGTDVTAVGLYRYIAILVAAIIGLIFPKYALPQIEAGGTDVNKDADISEQHPGLGRIILLCIGTMLVILLFYFSLVSPTTIARWAEDLNYLLVTAIVFLALAIFAWLVALRPSFIARFSRLSLLSLTGIYFLLLLLFLVMNRPPTVDESSALPIMASPISGISLILFISALILFPILLVDFAYLLESLIIYRPKVSHLAIGFSSSSLVWLILIVANVANRAGGYLPGIGPPFKQNLWLTYLIAGLILLFALFFLRKTTSQDGVTSSRSKVLVSAAGLITFLALASLAVVYVTASDPPEEPPDPLKVAAWNMMQGYDTEGQFIADLQLEKLENIGANLIFLSETDTAHIGGGNSDLIRYLADNLNMYSYYGPSPVAGTFGYALLSSYPIEDARNHFLYSKEEHAAIIEAQVDVAGQPYHLFVVHHDHRPENYEIQQEQLMKLLNERMNASGVDNRRFIVAGDYNFPGNRENHPDDNALLQEMLDILNWVELEDCPECMITNMVDHIFVSPNILVTDSGAIPGFELQHPIVWASIE
jgi:endonuclease/exonuclease/phosphatase family metal-dependent hydrolase